MPSVKVLNFELDLLNEIDNWTALEFCRSWQGTGDFTLTVCEFCPELVPGNIIVIDGNPHRAGIIRSLNAVSDTNGFSMTVSGQTLNGFTSQRIVLPLDGSENGGYFAVPPQNEHRNVSAEEIVKTYIDACLGADALDPKRRLTDSDDNCILQIAEMNGRGYSTEWGCRYTQLDEELQAICEYCDCGYEIYIDFDNKCYVAEYVSGIDRSVDNNAGNSWVILSQDFESINAVTYSRNYSSYKNVGYAGGIGEGADRVVIAVTNDNTLATGINRFETFVDCGDLESVETDTAISLAESGRHKLEEYDFVESLTAEVNSDGSFRYGTDWDLGDLVTVQNTDFGLQQNLRVTEVAETYEPERHSLEVTLGKPPKHINRAIRNIKNTIK